MFKRFLKCWTYEYLFANIFCKIFFQTPHTYLRTLKAVRRWSEAKYLKQEQNIKQRKKENTNVWYEIKVLYVFSTT